MKEWLTKHIMGIITLIALFLGAVCGLFAMIANNGDWRGLWLNLASECAGMAATLWIVDRLLDIKRRRDVAQEQSHRVAWKAIFKIENGVEKWIGLNIDIETHELLEVLNKVKDGARKPTGNKEELSKLARSAKKLMLSRDEAFNQSNKIFPGLNAAVLKIEHLQNSTTDEDTAKVLIDSLNLLFTVVGFDHLDSKK